MQQRLRVAADTLSRDLMMAGAGAYRGLHAGPLVYSFPPVLPFRPRGDEERSAGDVCGRSHHDYFRPVGQRADHARRQPLGAGRQLRARCRIGLPTRSGRPGRRRRSAGSPESRPSLVYDGSGSYNLYTIASAVDGTATLTARTAGRRRRPDLCRGQQDRRGVRPRVLSQGRHVSTDAVRRDRQ